MTIYCAKCQARLTSYSIVENEAIREVYDLLEKHVTNLHKESIPEFEQVLMNVGLLVTSYFIMHMFGNIPESEEKILKVHNDLRDRLLTILDIEVEERKETVENLTPVEP